MRRGDAGRGAVRRRPRPAADPRPGVQEPEVIGKPREKSRHEAGDAGGREDLTFFLPRIHGRRCLMPPLERRGMVRQGKAIAIRRQRHRRLPPPAYRAVRVRTREMPGPLLPPRDVASRLRSQVLSHVSRGTFSVSSRPVRDDRDRAVAPGNWCEAVSSTRALEAPIPWSSARDRPRDEMADSEESGTDSSLPLAIPDPVQPVAGRGGPARPARPDRSPGRGGVPARGRPREECGRRRPGRRSCDPPSDRIRLRHGTEGAIAQRSRGPRRADPCRIPGGGSLGPVRGVRRVNPTFEAVAGSAILFGASS